MRPSAVFRIALWITCSVLCTTRVHGENEPIPQNLLMEQGGSGGQLRGNTQLSSQGRMMQQPTNSESIIGVGGSNQGSGFQLQQGSGGMNAQGGSNSGQRQPAMNQSSMVEGSGRMQSQEHQNGGSRSMPPPMQGSGGMQPQSDFQNAGSGSQSSIMQGRGGMQSMQDFQNGERGSQSSAVQARQSRSGTFMDSQQEAPAGLRGYGVQQQRMESDDRSNSNGYGSSSSVPGQKGLDSQMGNSDGGGMSSLTMKKENPILASGLSNGMSDGNDGQSHFENGYSSPTSESSVGMHLGEQRRGSGGSDTMRESLERLGQGKIVGLAETRQQLHRDSFNEEIKPKDSRYQQSIGSIKYPDKVEGYAAGGPNSSKIAQVGGYSGYQGSQSDSSNSFSDVRFSNRQGHDMDDKPQHSAFNLQEEAADCQPLQPQETQVSPTWITSFPGSGSKMTWQSIEAITGIFTGDDMDSRGRVSKGSAVAIKTHYPSHTQENVFRQKKFDGISRAILVLRNPLLAIPGIFRFVYFVEQGNERKNKSDQPPRKAWIGWRNEYLESELKLWIDHAQFWLDNYKRENLHLLAFEYFVSPEKGSDELQKLGNFLGSADPNIASSLLAPEKFCCVWEKLVDHEENDSQSKKIPTYTPEQLELMIQSLLKLRNKNNSFPEFFQLMNEYIGEIVEAKKSVVEKSKY